MRPATDSAVTTAPGKPHWTDRVAIPRPLLWGYVGLLFFMVGDGVESNYLSPYLSEHGFTESQAATIIAVYGIAVAIASWFSGTLSALWGPKRVMMLGGIVWAVFQVFFLAVALPSQSYALTMISYGLRGFGFPLFAFSFLIWIMAVANQDRVSTSVGWFWFAFTGGLPTLGSLFASGAIPLVGQYATFWLSLGLVLTGACIIAFAVHERTGLEPMVPPETTFGAQMLSGIDILWRRPKVAVAGVVRIINTAPQYGLFVILPLFFTKTVGLSLPQYLLLVSCMYAANLPAGLFFGALGDRIGWRRTVTIFGTFGCAVATLILYYVPLAVGDNFAVAVTCAMLWGFMLSGYTPLPPLLLSMGKEEERGSAFAIYCLAAGLATFVGPALVAVFQSPFGAQGVVWSFTGLYLLSIPMALSLRSDKDPEFRAKANA